MKVFLTGASGFVGSNLAHVFDAHGADVIAPSHAELDLTDRCNVACYFCNQQDTRTRLQIPVERALRLIDEPFDVRQIRFLCERRGRRRDQRGNEKCLH